MHGETSRMLPYLVKELDKAAETKQIKKFLKKCRVQEERITEVCWVSKDGLNIVIYQHDSGR